MNETQSPLPPRDAQSNKSPALREKVVTWIINRVLNLAKSNVNVKDLQTKHNAVNERVVQMRVTDIGRSWKFRVKDGRIEVLSDAVKASGGFDIESETMIALAVGKRKMMDPASGKPFDSQFTPLDALAHGDLRIWGEAVSNDVLIFCRMTYREIMPALHTELGAPLEHAQNGP